MSSLVNTIVQNMGRAIAADMESVVVECIGCRINRTMGQWLVGADLPAKVLVEGTWRRGWVTEEWLHDLLVIFDYWRTDRHKCARKPSPRWVRVVRANREALEAAHRLGGHGAVLAAFIEANNRWVP